MDDWGRAALAVLAVAALIALLVWLWLQRRPTQYGSAPAHTTDAMWWLWQQLVALEPSTKLGGTFASKPGYHNYRDALPAWDYSVTDRPPDDGGPGDVCAAIDWTFPDAQHGDYRRIAKYTKRLFASAQDPHDPRLDGWREFFGQADDDTYVEGWDIRYGCPSTSDSSHLWHIHLSENRDRSTSYDNKKALLSVLKGESVAQWLAHMGGDGAVILNCPFDADRLDIFYVGPDGDVKHGWYSAGGMSALWEGNGRTEALGGVIVPGTLSAAWDPQGTLVNIIGLGAPDDDATPTGAGQMWGFTLDKTGARSGWGSLPGVYGQLPAAYARGHRIERPTSDWRKPATWLLVVALLLIAASLASLWIR